MTKLSKSIEIVEKTEIFLKGQLGEKYDAKLNEYKEMVLTVSRTKAIEPNDAAKEMLNRMRNENIANAQQRAISEGLLLILVTKKMFEPTENK